MSTFTPNLLLERTFRTYIDALRKEDEYDEDAIAFFLAEIQKAWKSEAERTRLLFTGVSQKQDDNGITDSQEALADQELKQRLFEVVRERARIAGQQGDAKFFEFLEDQAVYLGEFANPKAQLKGFIFFEKNDFFNEVVLSQVKEKIESAFHAYDKKSEDSKYNFFTSWSNLIEQTQNLYQRFAHSQLTTGDLTPNIYQQLVDPMLERLFLFPLEKEFKRHGNSAEFASLLVAQRAELERYCPILLQRYDERLLVLNAELPQHYPEAGLIGVSPQEVYIEPTRQQPALKQLPPSFLSISPRTLVKSTLKKILGDLREQHFMLCHKMPAMSARSFFGFTKPTPIVPINPKAVEYLERLMRAIEAFAQSQVTPTKSLKDVKNSKLDANPALLQGVQDVIAICDAVHAVEPKKSVNGSDFIHRFEAELIAHSQPKNVSFSTMALKRVVNQSSDSTALTNTKTLHTDDESDGEGGEWQHPDI